MHVLRKISDSAYFARASDGESNWKTVCHHAEYRIWIPAWKGAALKADIALDATGR